MGAGAGAGPDAGDRDAGDRDADRLTSLVDPWFDYAFCNLDRAIAGVCAWTSIIITCYQIYMHLKHYNRERHQKCT